MGSEPMIKKLSVILMCLVFSIAKIGFAQANQIFVDSAGRSVGIPDNVGRLMAAGPAASVLLYAVSPEKMVGWVKEPSAADKAFLRPSTQGLPVYGRITGKDGSINLAIIATLKPDLIIDFGDVNA